MQTECPHCHTVFRVNESDLGLADGQVRCGHCLAVFTADNPYNTVTYQDNDTPYTDEPDDISPNSGIVADVIPPELRAESRKGKPRFGFVGTVLLALGILISFAAIVFQYAYYNRENLVKVTELRPWLQQMCDVTGCLLPPPKDTKLIVLSSKNIFTHPNTENALMISATIVNQATFMQEFPIIELRFENVRGKTIAGRRFFAEEYLGIPRNQISQMQPDIPVNFNLEIKDPGSEMVSYEFTFL